MYLHMRSETPQGAFTLGGPAGEVEIECLEDGNVRVDMGPPIFEAARIPLLLTAVDGWYYLDIDGESRKLGAVSMGNPHALLVVDGIDTTDVAHLGAIISRHPAFPQGCNAGFAQVIDRKNIRLRVFERGADETSACGSGACAAMSILRRANLVDETVNVTQAGGNLILSWNSGADSVIMTGPATHVFEGNLE
jgi:diaminopimelate epimerase